MCHLPSLPRHEGAEAAADWVTLTQAGEGTAATVGGAATIGVCVSCLRRQGPAGSCNRLWCTGSGGSPSWYPWMQELACEGGGCSAPPPCATQQCHFTFQADHTSSVGIPGCASVTPVPSAVPVEAEAGCKGVVMVALPLACHSRVMPYFYGVRNFSHKLSWL